MTADITKLIIIGVIAYALGNINPSIIIGWIYGVDIRKKAAEMPERLIPSVSLALLPVLSALQLMY